MNTSQPQPVHWGSALQFGFSLLATAALLLFGAVALLLYGLSFSQGLPNDSLLLVGSGLVFSSLLVLPSGLYALLRLLNRPAQLGALSKIHLPIWLPLAITPILAALGGWVNQNPATRPLLPLFHISVISLPLWFFYQIGKRGLSVGSRQKTWGVFAASFTLGPLLMLVLEFAALLVVIVIAAVGMSQQPELRAMLERFAISPPSPQIATELMLPYIESPRALFGVLVFGAVIVPLIEEIFKPMGLWLLINRRLTAAQGLAAGLLGGTAYALIESLLNSASAGDQWLLVIGARIGTGLLHIVTTGIMGWAMVRAWNGKRYLELGLAYLSAVTLHLLWNGFTLLGSWGLLLQELQPEPSPLARAAALGFYVLPLLGVAMFALLFGLRRLPGVQGDGEAPKAAPAPINAASPQPPSAPLGDADALTGAAPSPESPAALASPPSQPDTTLPSH
ncbi:MAG: hypothetical protein OHK0052_11220 [Anaerolineales bacterium]